MMTLEALKAELESRGTIRSDIPGATWVELVAIGIDDAFQLDHYKLEAGGRVRVARTWHQKDGGRHREHAPAVEYSDGTHWYQEAWLGGVLYERLNSGRKIQVLRHLDDEDSPFRSMRAPMDRAEYEGAF